MSQIGYHGKPSLENSSNTLSSDVLQENCYLQFHVEDPVKGENPPLVGA
jgi:hypothetical protein